MLRKKGCVPSALTQNVKDFLASPEIENIFENSDFLVLLSQAQGDRQILAKQLGISPHQLSYVTHTNRSITARLKEGAAKGQEPPKEPGQKRNHKTHEDR